MDEMRLIDAYEAKKRMLSYYFFVDENPSKESSVGVALLCAEAAQNIEDRIDSVPTIDPESLPIVQKLREELATVTAERDVLTSLLDRAGKAEELTEKAYKERDAAICRLAAIEDILGDDYDLDRLRELVEADREGEQNG